MDNSTPPNAAKTRRTKADRFPEKLKILIEEIVIPDKYQDHLPHYRQSQRFRRRHGADTNLVENMIRPTKLGMKNWMFFGSLEAGTNSALIYTLLANCRAHDLDPEDYLIEVIKRLPTGVTPEQASN